MIRPGLSANAPHHSPLARAAGVLVLWMGVSCTRQAGLPPTAGRPCCRFDTAAELIPGDAEVVLRIAWSRVRSGPLQAAALGALPESTAGLPLGNALDRARAIFLGLRLMPDGLRGDGVVVIETDSTEMDEAALRASMFAPTKPEGHGSSRSWARSGRLDRFAPALLWVLDGKAVVVATASEVDAVERTARFGPDGEHLSPPARGLFSFSARVPRGATWAEPLRDPLRRLVSDLQSASGAADLDGEDVRITAELVYDSPAAAASAELMARRFLQVTLQDGAEPSSVAGEGSSGGVPGDRTTHRRSAIGQDRSAIGQGQESADPDIRAARNQLRTEGETLFVSVAVPLRLLAKGR